MVQMHPRTAKHPLSLYSCSCICAVGNNIIIVFGRYCYTDDLLHVYLWKQRYHNNYYEVKCTQIVSPLKPAMWELLLAKHPDRQFVDFLIRGLHSGFHVGCCASVQDLQLVLTNMLSAVLRLEVIE